MNLKKKVIAATLSLAVLTGTSMTAFAMTEHFTDASASKSSSNWTDFKVSWNGVKSNYEQVSLTPGADQTQLNLCWYSHTAVAAAPQVKLSKTADMSGAITFTGTQTAHKFAEGVRYFSSKVTVTGLTENTTYYYQYENNGAWSAPTKYTTNSFSKFKVLLVGDPQIGASVGRTPAESTSEQTAEIAARNDAYNWNATLNSAMAANPDASFLISAGDQINVGDDKTNQQEIEYAGYLFPSVLRSLPVATTIGNHDSGTTNYKMHFNNPNQFTEEKSPSVAGNGYYYTYGNALFIVINTNNYNCADHEALIKKAIAANPNAKWKILTFHQDIYGSGKDHSDSDGIVLRTQLTPIIDKYDIDVVLQGHDHTYSRTYQLSSDNKEHTSYATSTTASGKVLDYKKDSNNFLAQNNCYTIAKDDSTTVTNPAGAVYIEANSATGSKYYELISTMQDYIAARWQEWKPTYSVMEISDTSFSINTYEAESGKAVDKTYTIVKDASANSSAGAATTTAAPSTEAGNPKTGSSSSTGLLVVCILAAATTLGVVVVKSRRKAQ